MSSCLLQSLAGSETSRAEPALALARFYDEGNVCDRFEEFDDNLLLHRAAASSPPVDTLRLCVDEHMLYHTNTNRWVRRALRCSPAALHFRNRGGKAIGFSPSVAPAGGCRRLRILRLDNVTVEDGVMEQLDALFPVLEDLELRDCSYTSIRIASGTLRSLAIIGNSDMRFCASCLVAIAAAPRLATLRIILPIRCLCLISTGSSC
ncbi:hypothetical protein PR202_gb15595 [Eleusine coracana subsp. coracana]|uniref:F-box/LRR-repeat protein 15/At3g58940/PEG3-like LRR domain-containing protein n=1 Tax=Eleusine coracana subsp. coracana TaxID=191504 RepID=A0AAV5EZC9_ELECO|nr:hypothetical protein PR202_gb15595 [Eleusine coracana subsp. coracana]